LRHLGHIKVTCMYSESDEEIVLFSVYIWIVGAERDETREDQ